MTTLCCSVLLIIAVLAGNNAILILSLIPIVTIAAITTTVSLSSIATFFVMLFDDWKLSSAIDAVFYYLNSDHYDYCIILRIMFSLTSNFHYTVLWT